MANADARERQLQTVSDALFERASLQPGERVLDVGVGSGPTTGQAWEAVRPDGSVTGIDIAAPMINAARQRVAAPEIEWIVGDAAAYDFPPKAYDAVISRFGVMFFADSPAAFRNLCEATRPGGRLIMTVWSTLYATGLFGIPYTVATTTLHRLGAEYQGFPPNGILFSLGHPDDTPRGARRGWWADMRLLSTTEPVPAPDPTAAAKMTVAAGPVQALLEGIRDRSGRGGGRVGGGLCPSPERVGIGLPVVYVVAAQRPEQVEGSRFLSAAFGTLLGRCTEGRCCHECSDGRAERMRLARSV